jgi:hypothetical protein
MHERPKVAPTMDEPPAQTAPFKRRTTAFDDGIFLFFSVPRTGNFERGPAVMATMMMAVLVE